MCVCVCVSTLVLVLVQWHKHGIELQMPGPGLCENLIAFISQPAWPSPCLTLDMHYTWSLTRPDTPAPSLQYILSVLPWAAATCAPLILHHSQARGIKSEIIFGSRPLKIPKNTAWYWLWLLWFYFVAMTVYIALDGEITFSLSLCIILFDHLQDKCDYTHLKSKLYESIRYKCLQWIRLISFLVFVHRQ